MAAGGDKKRIAARGQVVEGKAAILLRHRGGGVSFFQQLDASVRQGNPSGIAQHASPVDAGVCGLLAEERQPNTNPEKQAKQHGPFQASPTALDSCEMPGDSPRDCTKGSFRPQILPSLAEHPRRILS